MNKITSLLIEKIGYTTRTEELSVTTMVAFASEYVNTAVLILLAGANFRYLTMLSWIPVNAITQGPYPDMTEDWYIFVAPVIISTMFMNIVSPWI